MVYRSKSLIDKTLDIDVDEFHDCTLTNCTLQYSGGHVNLHDVVMKGCTWKLLGAALGTIDLLRYINSTSGGSYVVDQIIEQIRLPYSSSDPVN
jgi:hypothetical protein